MSFEGAFSYALVFFVVHWTAFLIAAWKWPMSGFEASLGSALKFALGLFACLIVLICIVIFTDTANRGSGGGPLAGWFLVFSVLTVGVLPAFTLAAHVIAGRFSGWLVRKTLKGRRLPV